MNKRLRTSVLRVHLVMLQSLLPLPMITEDSGQEFFGTLRLRTGVLRSPAPLYNIMILTILMTILRTTVLMQNYLENNNSQVSCEGIHYC